MAEAVKYSVVYQGSKLFWRTRNTIDITIVQHNHLDITEIIAFKPAMNVEAKRIYLNSSILRTKLNQDEIDSKFSFAKQNNVPISVEFTESVMNHAISDFILPRLIISEFNKEDRYFAVKLEFRSSDRSPEGDTDILDDLVCPPPEELQPYETKNHKRLAPGEVEAALKALEDEKCNLDAACAKAAVLEAKAHAPLSGKERLRIPFVLIKMDSGKVLCAEDAKIWDAVSRSLKTDADIKRATDVTVKSRTTHAQLVAKKAAKKPLKRFRQVVDTTRPHYQQLDLTMVNGANEARTRENMEHSGRRASSPRNQKSNENSARNLAEPSSSRLLAGTAASQARADCAAEDNLPAVKGNHKKPSKRGNNKSVHGNNSKRSLRVSSRPEPCDNPESANEPCASTEADNSQTMEPAASLADMGEDSRTNFVGQIAASLSTIVAATFSSKNNPSDASFAGNSLSNERPKKMTEPLPTESVAATSDDTLAAETISRYSSLKPDPITASGTDKESLCAGGAESPVVPAKRRSYFGTLLATLLRGDSAQGGVFARTNSSESLPHTDNAAKISQASALNKKPAGLTSWLPWRSFGKNSAVAAE